MTISNFFTVNLNIEDLFVNYLDLWCQGVTAWTVIDTKLDDDDPDTKPFIVTLKSQYGEIRELKAYYVVGCNGGHSRVQGSLEKYDVKLEGDAHNSIWSAIDVVGFVTNFPDVKKVIIIHSSHSAIMVIPFDHIGEPSLKDVVATIHKVFHPFKFT
ncbi:hypothetical protein B0H10DRAFT_1957527 [Mycena sp. CBHHK59/15]|nr:hypothetical protein B0H10DRAFT_1957527 [Mycena sp. CBHHK59/15]